MKNKISKSIVLVDTDPEEVSSIILSLDYKKSDGPDEIPIKVIKLLNGLINPTLSNIINQCFQIGIFPDAIKLTKVIPLYKSGDKTNPLNYRPISILSVILKIVEKAILNGLKKFCDKYNIINEQQFGFREGYSTSLAIASVYQNLLSALDNGLTTCNVSIDLKKAFDSVDHDILTGSPIFRIFRILRILRTQLQNP